MEPNPRDSVPQSQVFPAMWNWNKTNTGIVILSMVAPQALVPVLVFTKVETFLEFLRDTEKSWLEFYPQAVREGAEAVVAYNKAADIELGVGK